MESEQMKSFRAEAKKLREYVLVQYWNCNNALFRLHADRPVLNVNDIFLAKIDAFQGRERDIVINALTIKDNPRFVRFVRSAVRVNTALSPVKNGEYIIMDTAALEKNSKNKIRFLSKLITYTKRERIHYIVLVKPTSPYVVKGEAYDRSVMVMEEDAEITDDTQPTENDAEAADATWGTTDARATVEATTGDAETTDDTQLTEKDVTATNVPAPAVETEATEEVWKTYSDNGKTEW